MSADTIPDDAMKSALDAFDAIDDAIDTCSCDACRKEGGEIIARAILAERNRCAQIAARHPGIKYTEGNRLGWRLASQHEIAAAIRQPTGE